MEINSISFVVMLPSACSFIVLRLVVAVLLKTY
jgi:hypothetical protein